MQLSLSLRSFLQSHHFCRDTAPSRGGCVGYSSHSHLVGSRGVELDFGSFCIPRSSLGRSVGLYFMARQRSVEYSSDFSRAFFSARSFGDYGVAPYVLAHGSRRSSRPNQTMKPTAPLRCKFSVFATTPCRGLSLSR